MDACFSADACAAQVYTLVLAAGMGGLLLGYNSSNIAVALPVRGAARRRGMHGVRWHEHAQSAAPLRTRRTPRRTHTRTRRTPRRVARPTAPRRARGRRRRPARQHTRRVSQTRNMAVTRTHTRIPRAATAA
jgi:hypothetical protein